MNKKTIITVLLALVAVAGQAKTFKTIKNPVAMACVNVSNGELKAREVIFRDGRGRQPLPIALGRGNSHRRMGAVARKRRNRLHDAFRAIAEEGTGIRLHRGRWLWGIQVVRHPRQEIQNQIPNDAGTRRR